MLCLYAPNCLLSSTMVMWPQTAQQQQISTLLLCSVQQAVHCQSLSELPCQKSSSQSQYSASQPLLAFKTVDQRLAEWHKQPDTYADTQHWMHLQHQSTSSLIIEDRDRMLDCSNLVVYDQCCSEAWPVQAGLFLQDYRLTLDLTHINCPVKGQVSWTRWEGQTMNAQRETVNINTALFWITNVKD